MPQRPKSLGFRAFEAADAPLLERWLRGAGLGVPDLVRRDSWSRRILEDERIFVRVAVEEAGEALGFVRLDVAPDRQAEVTLITAPDARRRGVGSALMERALQEARTRGLRRLVAVVEVGNRPARAFFRSVGFEAVRAPLPGFEHFERVVHHADRQPPLEIVP